MEEEFTNLRCEKRRILSNINLYRRGCIFADTPNLRAKPWHCQEMALPRNGTAPKHSAILSSSLVRWRWMAGKEIEVLVRSPQPQPIVDDLIASDDWALSQNPNELSCNLNATAIRDLAPIPY
jgi:hypothetical protein